METLARLASHPLAGPLHRTGESGAHSRARNAVAASTTTGALQRHRVARFALGRSAPRQAPNVGWTRRPGKLRPLSASGVTPDVGTENSDAPEDPYSIPALWKELRPHIEYMPLSDISETQAAMTIAWEAHDGQKRKSGEPYIIHPVAVACILGDLGMDAETVIAGLLHDTVEDTDRVTFESIEARFGAAVRRIVEGETKVSKISSKVSKQGREGFEQVADVKADDLQQMFLAMTEEVRVIIVKLADRLHNMRTLGSLPAHKRKRIADETLTVFAPLAKLLGMYTIKSQLEDLAFLHSEPTAYAETERWFRELISTQGPVVVEARQALQLAFDRDEFLQLTCAKVEVQVTHRELFSVHRKCLERGVPLENCRDVSQLRIVATLKKPEGAAGGALQAMRASGGSVCYHILGLVHALWKPIPGRMKDYIATPKTNGYRALHTQVLPFGSADLFPLELQIRTDQMHRMAECGIAADPAVMASWHSSARLASRSGRLGESEAEAAGLSREDIVRRVGWLNSIREWQEEFVGCVSPREFVDAVTGDLLVSGKRVFVFTPKGEVMNLPRGATVVDYAYHIHTELGNNMVAAKVNGVVVPPSHTLRNAEVVEIVTYKGPPTAKTLRMHAQWGAFCTTKSARHKILKFLRDNAYSALPPEAGAEGIESMADPELRMDWALEDDDDESDEEEEERGTQRALQAERKREAVMAQVAATAAAAEAAAPPSEDEGGPLQRDVEVALLTASASQLILRIECGDRTGLLADVSSLITRHGMSIRTYSGKPLDEGRGTCSMGFELGGDQRNVSSLCRELSMVPNVMRWRIYCTWSPPVGTKGRGKAAAGGNGASANGDGRGGVYNSNSSNGNGSAGLGSANGDGSGGAPPPSVAQPAERGGAAGGGGGGGVSLEGSQRGKSDSSAPP